MPKTELFTNYLSASILVSCIMSRLGDRGHLEKKLIFQKTFFHIFWSKRNTNPHRETHFSKILREREIVMGLSAYMDTYAHIYLGAGLNIRGLNTKNSA